MPLKGQKCSRLLTVDPTHLIEDQFDGYLVLGALIFGARKELREFAEYRQRIKIRVNAEMAKEKRG